MGEVKLRISSQIPLQFCRQTLLVLTGLVFEAMFGSQNPFGSNQESSTNMLTIALKARLNKRKATESELTLLKKLILQ